MSQRSFFPAVLPIFLCTLLLLAHSPARAGVDRWTAVGPGGGWVSFLVVDPARPEILYAGTGSWLFRSTTGAERWAPADPGLPEPNTLNLNVRALALHHGAPRHLYAATLHSLFRSRDRGRSWHPVVEDPPLDFMAALAVDPEDPAIVYAGGGGGVAKSTDGGSSWTRINAGLGREPPPILGLLADPGSPGTLFASAYNGLGSRIFQSTDGGGSWVGLPGLPSSVDDLILVPASPSVLYAAAGGGVYRSTDGGASWTQVYHRQPPGPFIGQLAASAADPSTLYGGNGPSRGDSSQTTFFKSVDGGATWAPTGLTATEVFAPGALAVSPGDASTAYVAVGSAGVVKTTDGGLSWQAMNQGLTATEIFALAVGPEAPSTLYAAAGSPPPETGLGVALLKSWEGGGSWDSIDTEIREGLEIPSAGVPFAIDPADPRILYAAFTGRNEEHDDLGGIAVSRDGGVTWSRTLSVFYRAPTSIALDPAAAGTIYVSMGPLCDDPRFCTGCPVYKSLDHGASWGCLSAAPSGSGRILVDPVQELLYTIRGSTIFVSSDGGTTWTRGPVKPPGSAISLLALDPSPPATLYASSTRGLFFSTDGGSSWKPAGPGLPAVRVASLVVDPTDPDVLYAVVVAGPLRDLPAGVFRSDDRGATWQTMDQGLPALLVTSDLAVDPRHPWIVYAGTRTAGLYRYTHRTPMPCTAGAETLCLGDGRFQVRVHWRTRRGRQGVGQAVPATGDTGFFWFFDPDNYELMIKVLDGTGLNGHFWVFYGALSNVQYSIEVIDSVTGEVRTYFNLQDEMASRGDTRAFEEEPAAADGLVADGAAATTADGVVGSGTGAGSREAEGRQGTCATTSTALCLQGNRFRVEVAWEDFGGHTGTGTTVPLTADSGAFWFFEASNYELVVKVLDGRGFNDHFWVFYGSLSNVHYTLTVTDTETGLRRTYENPAGTFASVADTEAF